MAGFVLRNTLSDFGGVARGVCQVDENQFLQSVTELTGIERDGAGAKNTVEGRTARLTGDESVSMNFWGFHPALFGQLKERFAQFLKTKGGDLKAECYIPSVVNDLVAAGRARVKVLRSSGSWFGVTYREDRPRVLDSIRQLIARGDYPEKL
jgi:hypothetical protein